VTTQAETFIGVENQTITDKILENLPLIKQ
jgi:hypothetical protein